MPAIKTKSDKATAFFRASYGQASIDKENGILRGVKLMELGCVATFKGEDGKAKSVTITPAHVSALLSHAGNRALPIHHTHEWFDAQDGPNADSAELNARIGCLKNFRRDESGNLVADALFNAGEKRDSILWAAEHNPEDTMFSAVFSYRKDDPACMPINFRAADVVPCGAATTALFSDNTEPTPSMDINELIAALADPKVQDAVAAIIKSHKADTTAADDAAAATMESDAGVTDSDKKPEDDQMPALMCATARMSRAFKRQIGEVTSGVKIHAEAAATALLGKGGKFQVSGGEGGKDEVETALAGYVASGAKNRATAIFRLAADNPALYNTARAAGKL